MSQAEAPQGVQRGSLEQRDAIAGVVMVAIAAGVGLFAWQSYGVTTAAGQPGTGFFPVVVAGVLLVLGIALTVTSIAVPRERRTPVDEEHGLFLRPRVLAFYLGVLLAAVLLMEPVGFVVTCAVLLTVLCKAIGGERVTLLGAAIYGVALSIGTYVLFAHVLGIALPQGVLPL